MKKSRVGRLSVLALILASQAVIAAIFLLSERKGRLNRDYLVFCGVSGFLLMFLLPSAARTGLPTIAEFLLCRTRFHLFLFMAALALPGEYKEGGLRHATLVCSTLLIIRAILQWTYGYARRNLTSTIKTGHNLEILQLEKYILHSLGKLDQRQLTSDLSLEAFYRRGPPVEVPIRDLFEMWKRPEETEGSVYEEYGFDLGESLRIPNRLRLTPEMEDVEGAVSVNSLLQMFTPQQANELFPVISYGERARIRYSTFKETFRQVCIERTNLYQAMRNSKELLKAFGRLLFLIEFAVCFVTITVAVSREKDFFLKWLFSFLMVYVVSPGTVSFCESFIFLLFAHPYDNGDRVFIDGENMVVRHVGLFSTSFTTWSGIRVIMQNSVISKLHVVNVRRSISQYWCISLPLSTECTTESILNLKKRLTWYVEEEKMLTGLVFAPEEITDSNSVVVKLLVRKNSNFQSGFFTLTNYTKCLASIVRIVVEEGLYYKPPRFRIRVTDELFTKVVEAKKDFCLPSC